MPLIILKMRVGFVRLAAGQLQNAALQVKCLLWGNWSVNPYLVAKVGFGPENSNKRSTAIDCLQKLSLQLE